jgi:16S rRNA (cytosine967-C5)-methyltransferase
VAMAFEAEQGREFLPVPAAEALAAAHVSAPDRLVEGPWLRLWPHRQQTDGFFAAVWQRRL